MIQGRVFDIQRFSIHDGPGIRTVVFLKGCPLRCAWCHNPESWAPGMQISWTHALCTGCGVCVAVCPVGAHTMEAGVHRYDRARCAACGQCAEACPSLALEQSGRLMTVAESLAPVFADKEFFDESGGGLTVSGGEPLMQADFTAALLAGSRAAGIHTAVETSGAGRPQDLELVARQADLVLYDIKAAPADYRRLTGIGYEIPASNLNLIKQAGCELWLRFPLIPAVNDSQLNFENMARLVGEYQPARVEIVPYHRLGVEKRQRMGISDADMPAVPTADQGPVEEWMRRLREAGVEARLPGGD